MIKHKLTDKYVDKKNFIKNFIIVDVIDYVKKSH